MIGRERRAALAPLRNSAATIIERPLGEKVVRESARTDGRLVVRSGWLRPARVSVSSGVTSADLSNVVADRDLSPVRDALDAFTAAAYRRTPQRDAVALDAAARAVVNIADSVARERRWKRSGRQSTARG